MVLDICNASADQDIEAASASFDDLALATYPGENIEEFVTEGQRLICIMMGGYALPYATGSNLITKVNKTSSDYFN